MPVIAKMESETGRERRLGWDMKISSGKKKGKKMSGLNMLTQCTLPSSRATICMCTPAATPTALCILHLN